MWAVAKKDFKTLFFSPIGYIVVSIFLIVFGVIMYLLTISNRSIDFNIAYNSMAWYGLPIVISVLTMRSFSEERNKDTEKLLFSSSNGIISIISGKILAVIMVIGISIILSLLYCLLFAQFGNINFKLLLWTIVGFILLSIAYASFGVLISSLTESQVISAIITLVFLLLPIFFSYGNGVFSYLSLIDFFEKFSLGIISIKSIVVLITFSIACILLTNFEIQRKRKLD